MGSQRIPRTLRGLPGAATVGTACALGLAVLPAAPALAQQGTAPPPSVEVAEGKAAEEMTIWGRRHEGNPYADPEAPFKVNRSASGKFTGELVDIPKSIMVVPKEVIEALGATSFKEVMRSQPGITLGTGEGGNAFGDRIFIRGFEARNDVYIDGFRDPGVGSRETFAVEQIEIVRGPGSAFAGRGSTGGAVNMVTKAPVEADFATAEVTVGTADLRRVEADVNHHLGNGLSVRLTGMIHDSGVPGRDAVTQERWGAAGAVRYKTERDLQLDLDYYHLSVDEIPDWGLPFDTRLNKPFERAGRRAFYGFVERDFREVEVDVGTLGISVPVDDGITVRNRTRIGRTTNRYVASAPERPNLTAADPAQWTMVSNPKNRNGVNRYVVNQTDATLSFLTGSAAHELVAGAEYSWEKVYNRPFALLDSEVGTPLGAAAGIVQPIFRPDPYRRFNVRAEPGTTDSAAEVTTKAIYVVDTVTFNENWQVFGGLRYDDYDLDYLSTGGRTGDVRLSSGSTFVNWHGGIVYKPVKEGSLYAAVSSSSNPSGEQLDGSGVSYGGIAPTTADLEPEKNRSYEVGVKWNLFDEHLSATAAVFRIDKVNARISGPAGTATQVLDGKQRVDGVELGLAGNITPDWSVFGGLTLLDTEVRRGNTAAEAGGSFPNIAETTFSLMSVYQLTEELSLGGQAYYSGEKGAGSTIAGPIETPAYWRFDLVGSYQVSEQVGLRLNVLNVTDKVYYDAIYRSGSPFAYIAPGRSVQLSTTVRF